MTMPIFLALAAAIAIPVAPPPAPIQVMVLGTYHFDNPGLDKINIKSDDVTTPRRQHELAALAEAIAIFEPTRVMVERQRNGPSYDVAEFHAFKASDLTTDRDETVQIGFRIAARAGLTNVQGIDEQPGKDEPDYFPFDKIDAYVEDKHEEAQLAAIFAPLQVASKAAEARLPNEPVASLLIPYNDERSQMGGQQLYYRLLSLGDGDRQPGADLNAMWYLRNAKIFSKLVNVARPGDRVLIVYGAGHGYWLRHFAATMPGFTLVDVKPYLRKAAAVR